MSAAYVPLNFELGEAYQFLAAPSCSSYIPGEILPIIGGYS